MNLDQLARYIDHISDAAAGSRDIPAMAQPPSPRRDRRALIAVAAVIFAVVGVATWAVTRHSDNSTHLRLGGQGSTGSSPATDDSADPPVMWRSLPGVKESFLPTNTPYAKAIKSTLNLDQVTILRRGYFDDHDVWTVSDEVNRVNRVNRVNLATGYQATIYHDISKTFIEGHDRVPEFGKSQTPVGKAWFSVQDGMASAVVVNDRTGVIVRVRYQDFDNHLPPAQTLIDKAIEISKNQTILDQVKNPASNTPPTEPDLDVASFAHFYDVSDAVEGDWQDLVPAKYRPCRNDGEETRLKVRVRTIRKDGDVVGYLVSTAHGENPTLLPQGASSACSGGKPDPQGNGQVRSWTTPCSDGHQVEGRWWNAALGPEVSLSATLQDC